MIKGVKRTGRSVSDERKNYSNFCETKNEGRDYL